RRPHRRHHRRHRPRVQAGRGRQARLRRDGEGVPRRRRHGPQHGRHARIHTAVDREREPDRRNVREGRTRHPGGCVSAVGGKKVLVTGADGFIGSHLTEMLAAEGAQVRALAQYNSFNSWGWLEDTDCLERIEVATGDIRDPHFARKLVADIEVVFHLAALIAIPFSYVAPDSYVATNVSGTVNLLQAAREAGVGRFLHTSTSEVYGTARYVPIDEAHPLQAQSPYSATKIAADAMAYSFFAAFGLPVTIVRPFNTYGPRQSARAVIPT